MVKVRLVQDGSIFGYFQVTFDGLETITVPRSCNGFWTIEEVQRWYENPAEESVGGPDSGLFA